MKIIKNITPVQIASAFLSMLMLFINVAPVSAMSTFQRKALKAGVLYANTSDTCDPTGNSGGGSVNGLVGKKIFFIGDSLTVGAVDAGLLDKARSAGLVLDTSYEKTSVTSGSSSLQRYKGKSIEATVGYRISNTIDHLKEHESDFSTGSADIVVIALGTNPESNFATSSASLITYLRSKNTGLSNKANILWLNTNYTSAANITPNTSTNKLIDDSSLTNNFTVLNIASDTSLIPDGADGIHYSAAGYAKRADGIVALLSRALISPSLTPSTGVLSYEDNHKFAWDYLVNKKGLSPNAAAGLMGNLEAESGINPQNMQNGAPFPDGPEMPSVINGSTGALEADPGIRGKWGYGIAQWTTASRQDGLLNAAKAQGKSSGAIDFQFDYLWTELESRWFEDVLAVLQNPNVTTYEASDYVLINFEAPASVIFTPETETNEEHLIKYENAVKKRREFSEKMLLLYGGSSFSGGGSTGCTNLANGNRVGTNGNTGYINPVGNYKFPLEPQTKRVGGIGDGWKGLFRPDGITPVHHDKTAAYDLFSFTDADVYSLTDGVIDYVDTSFNDIEGCVGMQLHADDGYYYTFLHMKNPTITEGTRVVAGQKLGEIADNGFPSECRGSSAHLHTDRGCVINGEPQFAGRDECRDEDYVEFLSNVYETLL